MPILSTWSATCGRIFTNSVPHRKPIRKLLKNPCVQVRKVSMGYLTIDVIQTLSEVTSHLLVGT